MQFQIVLIAAIVAVSVADVGDPNVKICGEYDLESALTGKDYGDYLEAEGISKQDREKIQGTKKVSVKIHEPKDGIWKVERTSDGSTVAVEFEPGKQFKTLLADGNVVTNTITIDQAQKIAKRSIETAGGLSTQEIRFTREGFTLIMKCKTTSAELKFKRK